MVTSTEGHSENNRQIIELDDATVRFAGDSGDGMQLAGTQMTNTSALAGNDVATFPDYPAEIRAPKGTLAGVSGFQVHFAAKDIYTPGEELDALVAMNPAALKTNLADLKPGGALIVNAGAFDAKNCKKAGYDENPLEDAGLKQYRFFSIDMTRLTREAVDGLGLSFKEADRCRNFFAMGFAYWLYGRSLEPTLRFIEARFGSKADVAEANRRALHAGWNFGETTEAQVSTFRVNRAKLSPGVYRNMTGNQATAWGLLAAAKLSGKELFLGTYPITPASDILHELSLHKRFGVRTLQAEDEIAAVCAAIGAAFAGAMAVTTTSGPGIALKSEAMGLAMMLELPLVVVSVQRGGPSTGLPTKTEQSDLLQVMFGRNGESPMPVIAAANPADCFDAAIEAWRIAVRFMTPVVLLSDGFIANGAEPWRIVDMADLDPIPVEHPKPLADGETFLPYDRDELLARPWAIPGTAGLEHRVGGLEKQDLTGNVSYDPDNHQHMIETRAQKVANVAKVIAPQSVDGPSTGKLLVVSWGGTKGTCATAVEAARAAGKSVAHAHLRHLHPFPENLGELLAGFEQVLVPELNMGQLRMLLRTTYPIEPIGLNKMKGKPFTVAEILRKIDQLVD